MKALSLHQPWASLMAWGLKALETRSFRLNYRGIVAIHASKTFPPMAQALVRTEAFQGPLRAALHAYFPGEPVLPGDLPTGAIVAVGRLTATWPIITNPDDPQAVPALQVGKGFEPIPDEELPFGDYSAGRFAWKFEDVVRLGNPIPAKGSLGLWDWLPGHVAEQALEQVVEEARRARR